MAKKFRKIVALFVLGVLLLPLHAVRADVNQGVTYLKGQSTDAWVTMALAAAGETTLSVEYLKTVAGSATTDYAKAVLAIVAAGENPKTYGNIDYVAAISGTASDGQLGSSTLINDDMWGIIALRSAGEPLGHAVITGAKQFIVNNQNDDGGWSYAVGGPSDSNDTAAAIMALVEAGVSPSDASIAKAVAYLEGVQNSDGGFAYQAGSASDAGSDSWVIAALNKLNQDPHQWEKSGATPISHLQSLQDTDGGFWWVTPGTSEWNNKAMTPFAVIALSGKSFPVARVSSATQDATKVHVRVEGRTATLCSADVAVASALDALRHALETCEISYTVTDSAYGQYVSEIHGEAGEGMNGWMYFVNNESPAVGAADYQLESDDAMLWYYGKWGWKPTRLRAENDAIDVGGIAHVVAEYFDSGWHALAGATVMYNGTSVIADEDGVVDVALDQPRVYRFTVDTQGYVRSASVAVTVGGAISQGIGMNVVVDQGLVLGDAFVFIVSPDHLDFGVVGPGQTVARALTLENRSTFPVTVSADIEGDDLFRSNIKIDGQAVNAFSGTMSASSTSVISVSLSIPPQYLGAGAKVGELLIWAAP